jgi:nucleotide-binding universal stress UspA family protein
VARIGAVATTLLEQAARESASMLVMATHARGPVESLIHGSVAKAVVAKAQLPVMVVRSAAPPAG